MIHRHNGKYKSRTPRGRITYKHKPIHKHIKRHRPVIRCFESERERHLDNIYRLQTEIKELEDEWEDKQAGISNLTKSAVRFDRDRFKDLSDEERKNLSIHDINKIFESEKNPYEIDMHQLIEEERDLITTLNNKKLAIEEEKEFLE